MIMLWWPLVTLSMSCNVEILCTFCSCPLLIILRQGGDNSELVKLDE